MAVSKDMMDQLRHVIRPHVTRIANTVARAVIQLVDDGKKLQLVQLGVLAGETIDGAEHHQPYGFSSVPKAGAEAVVVFPLGDRAHPLVVTVSDRRFRPTGGEAGEVVLYTDEGDTIRLGRGHVMTLATSGTLELGAAGASDGAIKGNSRDTAEQTFLTDLNTYITAIKPIADPTNAATPAMTAAITAFKAAITAAISTRVKLV